MAQRNGTTVAGAAATVMSAPSDASSERTAAFRGSLAWARLARLSLCLAGMPSAVGCLDSPPQYSEPDRVPPVIIADRVDPPPTKLLVVDSPTVTFNIAFRADDVGQRLGACFVRDIDIGAPDIAGLEPVPPDGRPFAEQPIRTISFEWQWASLQTPAGCHTLTAVLAEQNFSSSCKTGDVLKEARITWFVWLRNSPSDDVSPPVSCLGRNKPGATL